MLNVIRKQNTGETTDLTGYAIRVFKGFIYYFESDKILTAIPISSAEGFELTDLYRSSVNNRWKIRWSFLINGQNNKTAFRSAAAKMKVGDHMERYYELCRIELDHSRSIGEKPMVDEIKHTLISSVLLPEVKKAKDGSTEIKVKFVINPNYEDNDPVEEFVQEMDEIVHHARESLLQLEMFKGRSLDEIPDVSNIQVGNLLIIVFFKVD